MLLTAVMAFQLSRAGIAAPWPYAVTGLAVFAGLCVARWFVGDSFRKKLVLGATTALLLGVGIVTDQLYLVGEEILLVAMLWLAGMLFVGGGVGDGREGERTSAARVVVVAGAVVAFGLPGMAAAHRLPVICTTVVAGALWFIVAREQVGLRWVQWVSGAIAALIVVGVCVAAHTILDPSDRNPWYAAWVPTSGGDQTGSDRARRGEGDGPDEISGDSASSLGFDQGQTFSESGRDGLYDLWVESFGEPVKSGDQQKMIGIKPQDVRMVETNDRENLTAGRRFDMKREKPTTRIASQPTSRPDIAANAKVWVKGPMPVYIPLAVMDEYDGESWHVMDAGKGGPVVRDMKRDRWMEMILRPESPAFAGENRYEIKVGNLGGDVLPLPAVVERLRMGRVDRASFFSSTRAGLVRLARRTVPPGATVDVVCPNLDVGRLVRVEPALPRNSDPAMLASGGTPVWLKEQAATWVKGTTRGWRQILSAVEGLKKLVVGKPEGWPEYEVASNAVLMLRSLGYPTRLVSGLYGDVDDVDEKSGLAPLGAENVRFWAEVRLADGTWVTVDPVPGYATLGMTEAGVSWTASAWRGSLQWVLGSWVWLLIAVAVACIGWAKRVALLDGLMTAWCRLRGYRWGDVLGLVERRAAWSGSARRPETPLGVWLKRFDWQLAAEVNQGLYSDAGMPPGLGERLLRSLTRRKLLNLSREAT